MGNTVGRPIAQFAFLRLETRHSGHRIGTGHRAVIPRISHARDTFSSALLACTRMVLAGWDTGDRHSVLSRASAIDGHRAALHARSGGRQPQLADAHFAPRSGARNRFGLSPEAPQPLACRVRPGVAAVSRYLSTTTGKPPLRAALGSVVCASPSHRRLRRDFRGVAQAPFHLAA